MASRVVTYGQLKDGDRLVFKHRIWLVDGVIRLMVCSECKGRHGHFRNCKRGDQAGQLELIGLGLREIRHGRVSEQTRTINGFAHEPATVRMVEERVA